MQIDESFGRLLKQRRKTLDLTQEDLAKQVGCAVITIKKIESDRLRPSKQIAELLSKALHIPTDDHAAFVRLARATPRSQSTPKLPQTPSPVSVASVSINLDGQQVKGYELRERIGAGGFGQVYRAHHMGIGRSVAIKMIWPHYANHPTFIARFEAEAQIVAQLEHPHIVPLYDYWREPNGAYLVMRYVRGGSLQSAFGKKPWSLEQVTRLLNHVGAALHFAHGRGVVHRDVKPANILLDIEGNAYLADFGIAKDLWTSAPDELTETGAVIGSPDYLSPEQIKDEPITPQTDVYSLGIMLYAMLTSRHPFTGLTPVERLAKHLNEPLPALGAARPDLPAAFNTIIQRATAKRPNDRYPDVAHLLADWHRASELAASATHQPLAITLSMLAPFFPDTPTATAEVAVAATASDSVSLPNPYKGLRAFSEADAADFFGRATLTGRLLERLAEERKDARFLAVVGPSGSGKSSVVRAGVIPALRRGGLPGSERWFVVELIPGTHPLEELEIGLLKVAVQQPSGLMEQLQRDARGLLRAARLVLPNDDTSELVLVVDQFEELWTLVDSQAAREHFLDSLIAAVTDPRSRVRVLVTLRADFYDRPLQHAGLGELMRTRTEVVLPLTPDELEQAISGPAQRVGAQLEPGLARLIVKDVSDQPGTLPLLQYALTELFERREGQTLTLAAYQSNGGAFGALARRADQLYANLDPTGQEAARQLFLRLVTLGEGVEDTRRRIRRDELTTLMDAAFSVQGPLSAMDEVIDVYGCYRLLTFDRDPVTRGPTVEIAHEALIRHWRQLGSWLDASRANLRVQRQLATAAREWVQSERDPSFLATGGRLVQFEGLAFVDDMVLNHEEQEYLNTSLAERERLAEQDRAREAELRASLLHSEAQRLAAEANRLLQAGGNAELIALLAIASMRMRYTPQGDEALAGAAMLNYALGIYNHNGLDLVITSDGKTAIIVGNSVDAFVFDLTIGAEQGIFAGGHTDYIYGVALSPDGRMLATGGMDGLVCLWDVETRTVFATCIGHNASIWRVAFSPDGTKLLSGGGDQKARLWDVRTGRELRCFEGHQHLVTGVAFALNGSLIGTASVDGTARLWDVETGAEQVCYSGHRGSVMCIAIAPNGRTVVTGGADATVRLWDADRGRELYCCRGHNETIQRVVFSPDGSRFVSCCEDGTVRMWDVSNGSEVQRYDGHAKFAFAAAFTPDGRQFLTTGGDGVSRLWDAHPKPYLPTFEGSLACFSPDGKLVATGHLDGIARLWEVQTGIMLREYVQHTSEITSVAFTHDGTRLFTGSQDTVARVWDVATGRELLALRGHTTNVRPVFLSPDGRLLLTGSDDRTARLWDATSGDLLHVLRGHNDQVFDATFSPDGRLVVTGSVDGTIRLWDSASGAELRVLHESAASVAFTPDGATLITANWSGNISLWDVASGNEIGSLLGHITTVWMLRVSPSGRYLLSGSSDRTARLWDLQKRQEIRRFAGHTSGVFSVDFSPDERHVLTAGNDVTVRMWDIDYHDTIRYLCSRLLRDFSDDERAQYGISKDMPTCP